MKKLSIKLLQNFGLYKIGFEYIFEGDLIIISGVNGSGKSQLLKIIENNTYFLQNGRQVFLPIRRELQFEKGEIIKNKPIIYKHSIKENFVSIKDFSGYNINYNKTSIENAWNFYQANIFNPYLDESKKKIYYDNTLIFENGHKSGFHKSIINLRNILNEKFPDEIERFSLSKEKFTKALPETFIWKEESDIIYELSDIFYSFCCERAKEIMKYGNLTEKFPEDEWLKKAPWTELNKLFEKLKFKYRFKKDYIYNFPDLDEQPRIFDGDEHRAIEDLSDGEKSILRLALFSYNKRYTDGIDILLLDEFDATLNPSLIESFYVVLKRYFIDRGIQVIIVTHSPVTISLAPNDASFYEVFPQVDKNPLIKKVERDDYVEMEVALKNYFDKIFDCELRIKELENQQKPIKNKVLYVEDKYLQIYKIAYLKVKGINELTEENYDELFKEKSDFEIFGNFSAGKLYNKATLPYSLDDKSCISVFLFDFDHEGYTKYKNARDSGDKIYNNEFGDIKSGLYCKHKETNRYICLLPVPDRLADCVNKETSNDCFVEVETLLKQDFLLNNSNARLRPRVKVYEIKDDKKCIFWKDLLKAEKNIFIDFVPLFDMIDKLFAQI